MKEFLNILCFINLMSICPSSNICKGKAYLVFTSSPLFLITGQFHGNIMFRMLDVYINTNSFQLIKGYD